VYVGEPGYAAITLSNHVGDLVTMPLANGRALWIVAQCEPMSDAQSDHLDLHPSVVFASEPMDDDPGWQLIDPGALVHVDDRLTVTHREMLPDPPAHQLTLADLSSTASASQHST
jgi:hypothetical protein